MRNAISNADSCVCKNRFSSTISVVKLSKTGRSGSLKVLSRTLATHFAASHTPNLTMREKKSQTSIEGSMTMRRLDTYRVLNEDVTKTAG